MKKVALLISYPGEIGGENYCEGVNKDTIHYEVFLKSPIGGYWQDTEIIYLPSPSLMELEQRLDSIRAYDYSLIAFSGHGCYDAVNRATVLEINKKETIPDTLLKNVTRKQTLIIDACRKIQPMTFSEGTFSRMASKSGLINPDRCRKAYEDAILKCDFGMIAVYSCDVNEYAHDDSRLGGLYTYHLLHRGELWGQNTQSNFTYAQTNSIVAAHNLACSDVISSTLGNQNPQIMKPRDGKYFPFCVVV